LELGQSAFAAADAFKDRNVLFKVTIKENNYKTNTTTKRKLHE